MRTTYASCNAPAPVLNRSDRLPGLDLLRSIAILWVMLFHSFVVGGLGPSWSWLSRYGWMGVDIFFVLSGFLIGRQVLQPLARGEGLDFAAFYARRAWRKCPALPGRPEGGRTTRPPG